MTKEEILKYCLSDAYNMEMGVNRLLEQKLEEAQAMPELHQQLQTHFEESKAQANKIKACLEDFGQEVSTSDGLSPKFFKAIEPLLNEKLPDKLVKSSALYYAILQMGIATYKTLERAGEALEEPKVSQLAKELRTQKEQAAQKLDSQLASVWDHFREQALAGQETDTMPRGKMAPGFGEQIEREYEED